MKGLFDRLPYALTILVLVVLLASCSKDELVEPCGHADPIETKAASSNSGEGDASEASGSGGDTNVDDAGISDDGDDISGSERNRKRKTN